MVLFSRESVNLTFLPNELVSQIFWHCLPSDRLPTMTNDEAPLLLTRICSQWRRLAHATPELWTGAHLLLAHFRPGSLDGATKETEPEMLAAEDEARLPFIKEWFGRTADHLLRLTVSDEIIFANVDSCITNYILTLLPRVETLDLLVCRRTLPRFTELQVDGYQHLRKFRTVGDAFDPEDWAFLLCDAPRLTEFDARFLDYPITTLPLGWENLTRLAISYFPNPPDRPSTIALLRLLRQTPRLQSLRMVVGIISRMPRQPPDSIRLLDLHTMQLYFHEDPVQQIFPFLHMPVLTSIELKSREDGLLPALMISQGAFASKIEKLEVHLHTTDDARQIVESLEMVPRLRHLVVHYPRPDYDSANAALEILSRALAICPHLAHIDIVDRHDLGDSHHFECLRSASRHSRLQSLRIPRNWFSDNQPMLERQLQSFSEGIAVKVVESSGLDIEVGTGWLKKGFWTDAWYNA